MTSDPAVTVIMIFLDAERFMDEAIASVMTQTMPDFELLLCDDGSTDASTSIARRWVSQHPDKVRYLEHPGHLNRGMSATRNLGLQAARGELIAFIDADDVWRPNKLAEQLALMEAHPEVGMVCGTVRYWESWAGGDDRLLPTGHVRNRVVWPPESSLALYPLGSAASPCPSDMMVRRDAVRSVGGFEEQFRGFYEDQAFLAKLYLVHPVLFADSVWLNYRQHSGSISYTVARNRGYDEARSTFLTWFQGYLNGLPDTPPITVVTAVRRAMRPYRWPVPRTVLPSVRRVSGIGHRALRRLRGARDRWAGAGR
jgi:glycosyltransferase involved in cell wall biosynthesis